MAVGTLGLQLYGPTGPVGPTGQAGAVAAQGDTGPTGQASTVTGPTGPSGASGAAGAQGPAGPQGAAGSAGVQGAAGPQGATGATGATGANGSQGSAGSAGAQGPTGPQGALGNQGATGAAVVTLKGNGTTVGTDGVLDIVNGGNVTVTPNTGLEKVTITLPRGLIGPTGPQGVIGPQSLLPNWAIEYTDWDDMVSSSTTSNSIGRLGWNVQGGNTSLMMIAGRPGVVRRSTGTTSNTIARTTIIGQGSTRGFLPSLNFDTTWIIRLITSDANTVVRVGMDFIGFATASGGSSSDGIYFERLAGDTNWFGVTRSNNTETRVNTGVATNTDWVNLRLRRVNSTTIGFTVGTANEVTSNTNVPTADMTMGYSIYNTTAADKAMEIDYWQIKITGLER